MRDNSLPKGVTRPLFLTAYAVVAFLALFIMWSIFAPLSTTLQLTGKIKSSNPTIELQHPYGGLIGEVLVAQHDRVQKGQVLLRMDMSLEEAQLQSLEETQAAFLNENQAISHILSVDHNANALSPEKLDTHHTLRFHQALLQNALQRKAATQIAEQTEALITKIKLTEKQLNLLRVRQQRQAGLADQGLVKRSEGEVLAEQILIVQSEIEDDRASLSSLRGQGETATGQAELVLLSLTEQLIAARDQNSKQLLEIERQIAGLQDRIEQSVVRSPKDAIVSEIAFEARGMFATRGASLLSLTEQLDKPLISFEVSPAQIDQLQVGMTGKLIVTSLPQRSMPKVSVKVTAISPRAKMDENDRPIAYRGIAEIEGDSLVLLLEAMDGFMLTEDMPVQLLVSTGETTLFNYLVDPVSSAFRTAIQD